MRSGCHVKVQQGGDEDVLGLRTPVPPANTPTRAAVMSHTQTEGGVMFGEPTVIARAGAGGSVIGICAGPGPGSVTCTLQPHGVQIFDVASSTCTQSWALRGRRPALPAAVPCTHTRRSMRIPPPRMVDTEAQCGGAGGGGRRATRAGV